MSLRRLAIAVAAIALFVNCGRGGGSSTPATTTSTTISVAAYRGQLLAALDRAGQVPDPAALEAVARAWDEITPPEALRQKHFQFVAEMRSIAEAKGRSYSLCDYSQKATATECLAMHSRDNRRLEILRGDIERLS
jgi:hypothetical protein